MVIFQIVFLRWACDLLYGRGALESRDRVNNTSDRVSIRQLTWLPSGAAGSKVDISGSLPPEASLTGPLLGRAASPRDRQAGAGRREWGWAAGGTLKLQNLGSFFFFPIPHLQTHHILSHTVERKKKKPSFSYLIFGKPPGDHNLVLRTPPSLPLLETDTHTHTLTHTHADTLTHGSTPWWFKLQWLQIDPRDSYWKFRMDLWEDAVWRG